MSENGIPNNKNKKSKNNLHWADMYAQRIIREKGKKEHYTCASGITPSGTVHIGNFREIISVELVVRALRSLGENPRFIYSWDDFDVFRKVPSNIPNPQEFEQYLRKPIVDIPDPYNRADSYARGNELAIEQILVKLGIKPAYIYQSQEYRKSVYAEGMRLALQHRKDIIEILNKHRSSPLPEDWYPVSVFSSFTGCDTTKVINWDGEWNITYCCEQTSKEETIDLRTTKLAKLLWRIDWPMRWKHEQVDFEPAGKDHHSQGGSFDTARDIAKIVYDVESPVSFQYDFVRIKGGAGKLSSSSGEVVSVADVLEVYQAPIIRYLFASTRPNAEFAISFDLDVIKIYEDYDKCERIYYGEEEVKPERKEKESRIYELSQIDTVREQMPKQVPVRHLCNILQIYAGDIPKVLTALNIDNEYDIKNISERCKCAWNWIQKYAPEDFRFSLANIDSNFKADEQVKQAFESLYKLIETKWNDLSDKDINDAIYSCAREAGLEPKNFFFALYMRFINKEKGPRLGSFFKILGKDLVLRYLGV